LLGQSPSEKHCRLLVAQSKNLFLIVDMHICNGRAGCFENPKKRDLRSNRLKPNQTVCHDTYVSEQLRPAEETETTNSNAKMFKIPPHITSRSARVTACHTISKTSNISLQYNLNLKSFILGW